MSCEKRRSSAHHPHIPYPRSHLIPLTSSSPFHLIPVSCSRLQLPLLIMDQYSSSSGATGAGAGPSSRPLNGNGNGSSSAAALAYAPYQRRAPGQSNGQGHARTSSTASQTSVASTPAPHHQQPYQQQQTTSSANGAGAGAGSLRSPPSAPMQRVNENGNGSASGTGNGTHSRSVSDLPALPGTRLSASGTGSGAASSGAGRALGRKLGAPPPLRSASQLKNNNAGTSNGIQVGKGGDTERALGKAAGASGAAGTAGKGKQQAEKRLPTLPAASGSAASSPPSSPGGSASGHAHLQQARTRSNRSPYMNGRSLSLTADPMLQNPSALHHQNQGRMAVPMHGRSQSALIAPSPSPSAASPRSLSPYRSGASTPNSFAGPLLPPNASSANASYPTIPHDMLPVPVPQGVALAEGRNTPYRPGFQPKGVYRVRTDEFVQKRKEGSEGLQLEEQRMERRLEKVSAKDKRGRVGSTRAIGLLCVWENRGARRSEENSTTSSV